MRRTRLAARRLSAHALCLGLLLLSLLVFPGPGQAQVVLLALPKGGPTSVTEQEISGTLQGVRIQVAGRPLKEVLQRIQNVSGIQFDVASTLLPLPVTATIQAPDWPAALQQLLQPFNRGELRDTAGQLRHILVVGRGGQQALPPVGATYVPGIPAGPPEPSGSPEDPGTPQAPPGVTPPSAPGPAPPVGRGLLRGIPPPATTPVPPAPGPSGGGPPGSEPTR